MDLNFSSTPMNQLPHSRVPTDMDHFPQLPQPSRYENNGEPPIPKITRKTFGICFEGLYTSTCSSYNHSLSPETSKVSRGLFASAAVLGGMGAAVSGSVLITQLLRVPLKGGIRNFGAQGFNRVGKYSFQLGHFISGGETNDPEKNMVTLQFIDYK